MLFGCLGVGVAHLLVALAYHLRRPRQCGGLISEM
jgi:hypothetical protein